MQPVEVLPPRQRVSCAPERIEAGATGDQHRWFVAEFVCYRLEQVLPFRSLVKLVQHDERSVLRPRGFPDDPAILRNVPTQVLSALIEQGLGECRLPTLTWTGEKRSEEHTSELQSRLHLACRPLLGSQKATT